MKCKYSVRYFSSKGAYLVLLWTLLVFVTTLSLYYLLRNISPLSRIQRIWFIPIPFVVILVSAPLSGWLADAKFGNYKVFSFGVVLLFLSTVINGLLLIIEALVLKSNYLLNWTRLFLASSLFAVGACACIITALPLGLDQMPDASSSSIASYIAWSVCAVYFGITFGNSFNLYINKSMDETMKNRYLLLWALFLTICMSVILFSKFLFSPKWLIIEPKSPQTLKTIYQVLKFAAKHKAPLNRSAFTYWEKDIPSRIDLGKSKYGGPFTTEQVEDVKTTLRLIVITLLFFFGSFSFLFPAFFEGEIFQHTTGKEFHFWVTSSTGYGILGTIAYEFLVYPLFKNRLSGILNRIGAAFLFVLLISFVVFVLKLAQFLSQSRDGTTWLIITVLYSFVSGILQQVLLTSILEFMCAQSPYNMRGLLLSLVVPQIITTSTLGSNLARHFPITQTCSTEPWCSLILISVKTVFCLISFLLFCVVARWYKRRERDDNYSTQQVVEEVYDRYLTAAAAHTRQYGTHLDTTS